MTNKEPKAEYNIAPIFYYENYVWLLERMLDCSHSIG